MCYASRARRSLHNGSCVWRLLSAADLKLKGLERVLRLAFCRPQSSLWWKGRPVVKFNSVCRFWRIHAAPNQNIQRVLISKRAKAVRCFAMHLSWGGFVLRICIIAEVLLG